MEEKSLDTEFLLTLLGFILTCLTAIVSASIWWVSKIKKRRAAVEVVRSHFTSEDLAEMIRKYVPSRYSEIKDLVEIDYDTESFKPQKGVYRNLVSGMVRRFTRPSRHKYYIILADSGIGKTTFMVNLFFALHSRILPFIFRPRPKTEFIHLGGSLEPLEKIQQIPDKVNTIVLLDGLDEYNFKSSSPSAEIQNLLQHLQPFREIVITVRTQFFATTMAEIPEIKDISMGKSGRHSVCRFYLAPFTMMDVLRFLNNEFPLYRIRQWKMFAKSLRIVKKIPRLRMRPLLLSHIRVLIDSNRNYVYSADVFEELIRLWITWEAQKPISISIYGKRSGEVLLDLSKRLARRLYETGKNTISEDEDLGKEIAAAFLVGEITATDTKDLHRKTKYRSLLTRWADHEYRFSHKSIMEYLVAVQVFDTKHPLPLIKSFDNLDVAALFYYEMLHRSLMHEGAMQAFVINQWKPFKDINPTKLQDADALLIRFSENFNFYPLKFHAQLKEIIIYGIMHEELLGVIYQSALPEYDALEATLRRVTNAIKNRGINTRYRSILDILDIDNGVEEVVAEHKREFNEPRPVLKITELNEGKVRRQFQCTIDQRRQARQQSDNWRDWLEEHDALVRECNEEIERKKEAIRRSKTDFDNETAAWELRKISFDKNEENRLGASKKRKIADLQKRNYENILARLQPVLPMLSVDIKLTSFMPQQRRSMMQTRIDTLVERIKKGDIQLEKLNGYLVAIQKAQTELPGIKFFY